MVKIIKIVSYFAVNEKHLIIVSGFISVCIAHSVIVQRTSVMPMGQHTGIRGRITTIDSIESKTNQHRKAQSNNDDAIEESSSEHGVYFWSETRESTEYSTSQIGEDNDFPPTDFVGSNRPKGSASQHPWRSVR